MDKKQKTDDFASQQAVYRSGDARNESRQENVSQTAADETSDDIVFDEKKSNSDTGKWFDRFKGASNIDETHQGRQKSMKIFGGICLGLLVIAMFFINSTSIDESQAAADALQNHTSVELSAGARLLSTDESIEPMDYVIQHDSPGGETKIFLWDYAAEDGDYVQVLVDGEPLDDAFMVMHEPREYSVPSVGVIQVKGIRDGGGGITYGIFYNLNGTTYFNSAPEGEFNTYTLVSVP